MMWKTQHCDELYVYHNGVLIFKRWINHARSVVFHGSFIAMLLMVAGVAGAQDVSLIVSPQAPIELGEPIELDAVAIISKSARWKPLDCKPAQCRLREKGHVLSFWAKKAGIYRFEFTWVTDAGELDEIEIVVTVIGNDSRPEPTPGPQPLPGPTPGPRFPDQVLGLSTIALEAGSKVKYPPDIAINPATDAAKLATAFRGVAAKVDAGALKGQAAIVAEQNRANREVLSGDATRITLWKSVTTVAFSAAMTKLEADGKLKTDRDIADAWKEFATGLESIR